MCKTLLYNTEHANRKFLPIGGALKSSDITLHELMYSIFPGKQGNTRQNSLRKNKRFQ